MQFTQSACLFYFLSTKTANLLLLQWILRCNISISLSLSLSAVSPEKVVVNKERSSGSYHLSAYYLAKTVSEMPLILLLPSIYIIIVYWAAGLNSWSSFFGSWFFILFSGFMAQVWGSPSHQSCKYNLQTPPPSCVCEKLFIP